MKIKLKEKKHNPKAVFWGVGRRKESVARIRLLQGGSGNITVNGRNDYFLRKSLDNVVNKPLIVADVVNKYDIIANVRGGGVSGQASAIALGISRSLAKSGFEKIMRQHGLLTRDKRVVQAKNYGRKKARKRFQFSKR